MVSENLPPTFLGASGAGLSRCSVSDNTMFDARVSVASGEASEFAIVANYSGLEKSGDAHGSWRRQVSDGSLVFPERSQGQPSTAEYSDSTSRIYPLKNALGVGASRTKAPPRFGCRMVNRSAWSPSRGPAMP